MQLPNPKITKTVSQIANGAFDVISVQRENDKHDLISSKSNYILVLPFEKTADNKIKSIYALESNNLVNDSAEISLISDTVDPRRDQTAYDAVCRALIEEAGLNLDEVGMTEDDIFYLGNISMSVPVTAKFKCYAVDLSKISGPDPINFTRTLSKSKFTKDDSKIVKLGFHQVVNGDFSDSTILSGAFLLVAYFS